MKMIRICAIRGRSDGDWYNSQHRQRLEIGGEISNSITTVQKDNLIYERDESDTEIRKNRIRKEDPQEIRSRASEAP